MRSLPQHVIYIFLFCFSNTLSADENLQTTSNFGHYTVHYSTFNSTFIKPDIATIYKLTRGDDQTLINISLTQKKESTTSLGIEAVITGTATNLLQQQKSLKFKEIREANAIYYIASLRHSNEEMFHFNITVQPKNSSSNHNFTFTKKLYKK